MKKIINYHFSLLFILALTSCANLKTENEFSSNERYPAGTPAEDCKSLVERIISKKVSAGDSSKPWEAISSSETSIDLLKKAKRLSTLDKVFVLHLPAADWFNAVRRSVLTHLKTWNKNRYPLYYLSKDNNYEIIGKNISVLLEKQSSNTLSEDETKMLTKVMTEIDKFTNYQKDVEAIINERASLQYNLKVLKSLVLENNEPVDLKLTIKKATGDVSEIVTIRKEDYNRPLIIDKYRKLLIEFNGHAFRPGVLEDRILKQAMLKDIVTIYHREVEYAFKNSVLDPKSPEYLKLQQLYDTLTLALKNSDFDASAYGMFRLENQTLRTEFMRLTKADQEIQNSQLFRRKLSGLWQNLYMDPSIQQNPDSISTMKKAYLTVVNLTTLDFTNLNLVKVGIMGVAGVSLYNYFAVNPSTTVIQGTTGEVTPGQVDSSQANPDGGSSVQEIQDPELTNSVKKKNGFIADQFQVFETWINKVVPLK